MTAPDGAGSPPAPSKMLAHSLRMRAAPGIRPAPPPRHGPRGITHLEPLAEGARALDLRAERPDAAGELAIRGHDPHRSRCAVRLQQAHDLVVCGVAASPWRDRDLDAAAAARELRRAGVEHDGHGLPGRLGE